MLYQTLSSAYRAILINIPTMRVCEKKSILVPCRLARGSNVNTLYGMEYCMRGSVKINTYMYTHLTSIKY